MYNQIAPVHVVDIPSDSDLADFFPSMKNNTFYRVKPNTGVRNTCVPNNQHSFYTVNNAFVVGYGEYGDIYLNNYGRRVFSRWVKLTDQFTNFEQLNLSDEDFSETDFANNLMLINNAAGYVFTNMFMIIDGVSTPNFHAALIQQLKNDGFDYSAIAAGIVFVFKLERQNSPYAAIKIELILDGGHSVYSTSRDITIVAYANRDGNNMLFYGFHQLAAVQKTSELTLLNGWKSHAAYRKATVARTGDIVTITGVIHNDAVFDSSVILAVLPQEYRPLNGVVQMVAWEGKDITHYVDIFPNGNLLLYEYESTNRAIFLNFSYGVK